MDRRVKERLVGASILVVLIVLIVPALLSGPAPAPVGPRLPVSAPEPVRNVTVDLSTSKPQAPEPAAADPSEAAASAAEPPEARSTGAASAAAGGDASAGTDTDTGSTAASPKAALPKAASTESLETAAPPPITAATAAKPAQSGHAWAVQLGSFASRVNAEKLVRHLKAQGFSVYLVSGGSGGSLRYRVRIGPLADRGSATQEIAKLKSLGQGASLVPPAR
jgi:DedD protein